MKTFPAALERLSEQFARLPGIGSKTAQRLAFQVLSMPQEQAQQYIPRHPVDDSDVPMPQQPSSPTNLPDDGTQF